MARPRKTEDASGEPKSMARDLNAAVAYFKEAFPDDWDELALCPLQHGLETMAHKLAAKG